MDVKSIKNGIQKAVKFFLDSFKLTHYTTANISLLEPNKRLLGKKIVITGGGSGLGYYMAKKFVDEGGIVLITGRREDVLKTASEELGCHYICFDVSKCNEMDLFIQKADNILDGIDCIVNNAGISLHEGDIRNVSESGYDQQFGINLKGGYFLSQSFINYFEKNKRTNGSILFVSSERGQYVDDIPYGLIKAAINSLTQGMAKLLIRSSIRVNAVAPGVTVSDMTGKTRENLYSKEYATGRFYLPEEVAEVACFLLSDVSSCLSGQILICNNGFSVNSYK